MGASQPLSERALSVFSSKSDMNELVEAKKIK